MPTSASSNNPHVRMEPEDHDAIRHLSVFTGYPQGRLVGIMAREKLHEMGNPQLQVPIPRRKREAAPSTRIGKKQPKSKITPVAPRRSATRKET